MAGDPNAGNTFLEMQGMQGLFGKNPYTSYPGALPMPGYAGWPTDAMGNPIAATSGISGLTPGQTSLPNPPPGTTLNSVPAQPTSAAGQYAPGDLLANAKVSPGAASWMKSDPMMAQIAGWQALNSPEQSMAGNTFGDPYLNMVAAGSGAAPAAAPQAQPAASPGLTRDQYLQLASNPGNPPMPGATVPQSQPVGQEVPSVLQSFLAAHPSGGGTGAGNYSNTGFFNTLQNTGTGAAK